MNRTWPYAIVAVLLLTGGCVQRTMIINSNPPGALVYLNGQEVGRTPLTHDFVWYGDYDVRVTKDGYEPLVTHCKISSVLFDMPPFDLITELTPFPWHDHQKLDFTLKPAATQPAEDSQALVDRAAQMRTQLESSQYTRPSPSPATPGEGRGEGPHVTNRP